MNNYDPNGLGIANGNIFGFPVDEKNAEIVIIPVPWDATASYKKGTAFAPETILKASTQLDFFHPLLNNAYKTKVFMAPISKDWMEINQKLSQQSTEYLNCLENEGLDAVLKYKEVIDSINEASRYLNENLYERCIELIKKNVVPVVLGGEHSVSYGLIKALEIKYDSIGILQIDAHADLRESYESFSFSHASIMYNVLNECSHIEKLVQVGVRDICESEALKIEKDKRIKTFFDWDIKSNTFNGKTWNSQCLEIVSSLPENIYLSIDIDGLNPELCPNTGTPVPGGLTFNQVEHLFHCLRSSNKNIVGFDLVEVALGNDGDWDANVGARILWKLICLTEITRKKNA